MYCRYTKKPWTVSFGWRWCVLYSEVPVPVLLNEGDVVPEGGYPRVGAV